MTSTILERPRQLLRAHPREAAIAVGMLAFSAAAMASVAHYAPAPETKVSVALPPVLDMANQPIAPEQALQINRANLPTGAAGPAAAPFALGKASGFAREAALDCLSQAVYYEAGQESEEGQRAVAQVVLNRVRHPAFPASVCAVVYQGATRPTGCQFTFTCDGSLERRPDLAGWARARKVASDALNGSVYGAVGNATHYHADYVLPVWAASLSKSHIVGAHLFYRWAGNWGQPQAFAQRYSAHEVSADVLRDAAITAHRAFVAAGTPTAAPVAPPVAVALKEGLLVRETANGRVRLHFTPQARAAVEEAIAAPRAPSEAETKARVLLDAGAPAAADKPLGS